MSGKTGKTDLKTASLIQLNDILDRQDNLLKNTKFLQSLPDKGAKILKFHGEVKDALAKAKLREAVKSELVKANMPLVSTGFTTDVYDHVRMSVIPLAEREAASAAQNTNDPMPELRKEHETAPVAQSTPQNMNIPNPELQIEHESTLAAHCTTTLNPDLQMEHDQESVNEAAPSVETSDSPPELDKTEEQKVPVPVEPHIFMHFAKAIHDQQDTGKRRWKPNEPRVPYVASPSVSEKAKTGASKYFEALAPPSTTKPSILLTLQESMNLLNEQNKTQDELQREAAEKCLKTWNHIMHGEATAASGVKNLGVTFRVPVQDLASDEEDDLPSEEDCITEESEPEGGDDGTGEFLARLVNASIDLS